MGERKELVIIQVDCRCFWRKLEEHVLSEWKISRAQYIFLPRNVIMILFDESEIGTIEIA